MARKTIIVDPNKELGNSTAMWPERIYGKDHKTPFQDGVDMNRLKFEGYIKHDKR